ncbi:MAG: right-handed parallel beta-helix repeat-containing protein [Saprospiraceae bacterium]
MRNFPLLPLLVLIQVSCQFPLREISLEPGMTIRKSCIVKADTFRLPGTGSLDQPALTIEGNDITVDFNGAVLRGNEDLSRPDLFTGLGILVRGGGNITLKNLKAQGYKAGLMATGTDSLVIERSDFSYNYRQRLRSWREREDLSDWLSYHHNETDEWLRYGAGIYLKNCHDATVRETRITGGQNGLMLTGCDGGLFYNNTIQYNSGLGIGMYRSSGNRVLHNKLDWNVRGHSPGFYRRGQDSAGILCYEQSNRNVFAHNSATHSGDGFFLWAGQETMDSGQGGCNDNLLFGNDFSYAPTNGIEVTFSRNFLINNKILGCRYGIWGGYSYETVISGNEIRANETGIAIEHGQDNTIVNNLISDGKTGLQLWARDQQPADWGYAQARDVSSRHYNIDTNCFLRLKKPLDISKTRELSIHANRFFRYENWLDDNAGNEIALNTGNHLDPTSDAHADTLGCLSFDEKWKVAPLPGGIDTRLSADALQGTDYILMGEWGPYNFAYPTVWLRAVDGNRYTFLLLGPPGNWKLDSGEGWASLNQKTGSFPATVVAEKTPGAQVLQLDFTFLGPSFTDEFGRMVKKGTPYKFTYNRVEPDWVWAVDWYNADSTGIADLTPVASEEKTELFYAWWGAPAKGADADRFLTRAVGQLRQIPEGDYLLLISSDDGVRVWVDGDLRLDHWDVHEPATDEIRLKLGGDHTILIEHFEAGGFATLSARLIN